MVPPIARQGAATRLFLNRSTPGSAPSGPNCRLALATSVLADLRQREGQIDRLACMAPHPGVTRRARVHLEIVSVDLDCDRHEFLRALLTQFCSLLSHALRPSPVSSLFAARAHGPRATPIPADPIALGPAGFDFLWGSIGERTPSLRMTKRDDSNGLGTRPIGRTAPSHTRIAGSQRCYETSST